jgi:hypothetical protein
MKRLPLGRTRASPPPTPARAHRDASIGKLRAIVYASLDPLTGDEIRLREVCATHREAEVALTRLQNQVDEDGTLT